MAIWLRSESRHTSPCPLIHRLLPEQPSFTGVEVGTPTSSQSSRMSLTHVSQLPAWRLSQSPVKQGDCFPFLL